MLRVFDCRTCRENATDEWRAHHGCPDQDTPAPVDRGPEWDGTPIGRTSIRSRVCPGALLRYPGPHWHVGINGQRPADLADRILFQRLAEHHDAPAPMVSLAMAQRDALAAAEARDRVRDAGA